MEVIMKTNDAIAALKSAAKVARALGIKPPAVSQWGEYVPEISARGLVILNPEIPHVVKKPQATA